LTDELKFRGDSTKRTTEEKNGNQTKLLTKKRQASGMDAGQSATRAYDSDVDDMIRSEYDLVTSEDFPTCRHHLCDRDAT